MNYALWARLRSSRHAEWHAFFTHSTKYELTQSSEPQVTLQLSDSLSVLKSYPLQDYVWPALSVVALQRPLWRGKVSRSAVPSVLITVEYTRRDIVLSDNSHHSPAHRSAWRQATQRSPLFHSVLTQYTAYLNVTAGGTRRYHRVFNVYVMPYTRDSEHVLGTAYLLYQLKRTWHPPSWDYQQ
jgi:hypothetical protein